MRSERTLTAAEQALRRLDESAELLNPVDGEEFVLEVADTVRTYLAGTFDLGVLPHSLSDFARNLPARLLHHQGVLEHFAALLDFAESMQFDLGVPELEAVRDSARHVIIRTTLTGNGAVRAQW